MERKELKSLAKDQLKGKWGSAALTTLAFLAIILVAQIIYGLVTFLSGDNVIISFIFYILFILFIGVISVGIVKYSLNFTDSEKEPNISDLFSSTSIAFKILGLNIATGIIIFIGTIFFVIPGIIAALALSQSVFILAEDPSKSIKECLKESYSLMKGHKWEYFVLGLSFIGWIIVSMFTLYIGLLWVYPYMMVTYANYYLGLKKEA